MMSFRKVTIRPIFLALVLALSANGRLRGQDQVLVVDGATLINGTGKPPVADAVVVMESGRIKAAGARGSVAVPAGAKVINGRGKTLLPGLIDAHIHYLDFTPQMFLRFGVTTVVDTANPTEWILAQRDALKDGKIKGPRMFATGLVIDGPLPPGEEPDAAELSGYKIRVKTSEEARVATRKVIRQGVDAVKVHEALSTELLQAVVEEAHRAGLEVVGHIADVRAATGVGMKFIEHTFPITDATVPAGTRRAPVPEADMDVNAFGPLIEVLVKNGVYFNPTLTRTSITMMSKNPQWTEEAYKYLSDPKWKFIPEGRLSFWLQEAKKPERAVGADLAARRREGIRRLQEFVRRYAEAGGKLITGPDTGSSSGPSNFPGLSMHIEMEALVDAGVTPMQAIMSSTKWPAELVRHDKELGTVEPGKLADAILIDGDPLADIRNTRRISAVIQGGKVVDTTIDPDFRNPLPRAVSLESVLEYMGPHIGDLEPKIANQGQSVVKISVAGEWFKPNSIVRFDTKDLPTTFKSDKLLEASIPAAQLKNIGTYAITVINPGSGGGTSNVRYFVVNFPGQ